MKTLGIMIDVAAITALIAVVVWSHKADADDWYDATLIQQAIQQQTRQQERYDREMLRRARDAEYDEIRRDLHQRSEEDFREFQETLDRAYK